jgi:hypothetical protein
VVLDKTQGTSRRILKMSMNHSLVHLPSVLKGVALCTSSTGPPVVLDKTRSTSRCILKMSITHSLVHLPSVLIGGRSTERTVRCAMRFLDPCKRTAALRRPAESSGWKAASPKKASTGERSSFRGARQVRGGGGGGGVAIVRRAPKHGGSSSSRSGSVGRCWDEGAAVTFLASPFALVLLLLVLLLL